ncbi:MAG: hypothetical protein GY820_01950 [Gammaproteobacteria bacterium]|nr:hypothetical protein [Gammaproteobacteria bacterium]
MHFCVQIDFANQWGVIQRLRQNSNAKKPLGRVLQVGTHVRIQLPRGKSGEGPRYSEEVFTVAACFTDQRPALYKLTDQAGGELSSYWYRKQLAPVE